LYTFLMSLMPTTYADYPILFDLITLIWMQGSSYEILHYSRSEVFSPVLWSTPPSGMWRRVDIV
jgi:hypothetical protein